MPNEITAWVMEMCEVMLPIGKISVPCIDVNRLHTEIDAWNATLMKIYTNKQFQS